MLQPWIGVISAIAAIVVGWLVVVRVRRRPKHPNPGDAPIANVHHAAESAVYRRLRRRYNALIGVEVVALCVVALSGVALTMRPVGAQTAERDVRNRDVMLCLDVSGSMIDLDAEILATFATLAAGLDGERIGLTIWNGSAVSVFPLTDDTEYIAETLADAAVAIVEMKQLFLEGTSEGGSSLIGDGLASCALRFDRLEEPRPRSIVFATDNMRAGSPIMPLPQAGDFAAERDIRVYAIAAAHTPDFADDELREVAKDTGGTSFSMTDAGTVDAVLEQINDMEAARLRLPTDMVTDDRPAAWIGACLAGIGLLGLASWRLRR